MAEREVEFIIPDVNQDDYENASSGFITLPPINGRPPKEGDSIILSIEAGEALWKTPGKSLDVPFTVIEKGDNFGKITNVYPGVTKDSLSILKAMCKALGVESKVITYNERKQLVIKPKGFIGGKGVGVFVGTWTVPQEAGKQPSLVAKLATTQIFPVGYGAKSSGGGSGSGSASKDLGI